MEVVIHIIVGDIGLMKVVILDAKTLTNDDIDFSVFDEFGEVTIYDYTKYNQIAERIKDAEIILCNKSIMNRMTLKDAKNVKYIGLFATGYNNVDIEYTNEKVKKYISRNKSSVSGFLWGEQRLLHVHFVS